MAEIFLDKQGVWHHDGVEVTHERTLDFMFRNVYFADGHYYMKGEKMPVPVKVADVAFFVRSINRKDDQIEVKLSDGTSEMLNFSTLDVGVDSELYCRIKEGTVAAKFERKAYNDLAVDITERHGYYGVLFAGIFYPIQKIGALEAPKPVEASPAAPTARPQLSLVKPKAKKAAKPAKKTKTKKVTKSKKKPVKKKVTKKKVAKKKKPAKKAVKKTKKKKSRR